MTTWSQATARIEGLGGSRLPIEDFSEDGFSWRVMADPEGNEFRLIFTQPYDSRWGSIRQHAPGPAADTELES